MIAATVRSRLPPHIDREACRAHFHKTAPGFLWKILEDALRHGAGRCRTLR